MVGGTAALYTLESGASDLFARPKRQLRLPFVL
jgi:hypothetical protein